MAYEPFLVNSSQNLSSYPTEELLDYLIDRLRQTSGLQHCPLEQRLALIQELSDPEVKFHLRST